MSKEKLNELQQKAHELCSDEIGNGFVQTNPLAKIVEELIILIKEQDK